MKIALICPSNKLYMPYVNNYEKILKANNVNYDVINWDRCHIEDENSNQIYRDSKVGHQRNYFDYYKYKKFILKKLYEINYDKVIVFSIQLAYYLKSYLLKNYKGMYLIDIRDHNKILNFFNMKRLVNDSRFTVISSPGYKNWLPNSDKYIINHNTQITSLDELKEINFDFNNEKINISNIGSIRDCDINIAFINSLQNKEDIDLYFHGESDINEIIDNYTKSNNIRNVVSTGRYYKDDEEKLYNTSKMINVLIPTDDINSKTLLPNRLYNAALYGKPIIAYEGTYLAKQVRKYELGLILHSFNNVEEKIKNYLIELNTDRFQKQRVSFLKEIIKDNEFFRDSVEKFISI